MDWTLLSILQIPNGVPVATVSVNGAKNAAILACQIIALHNNNFRHKMAKLKTTLVRDVEDHSKRVRSRFPSNS